MSGQGDGRPRRILLPGGRFLDLEAGPLVMGIVNCTDDSFYPGSRARGVEAALRAALAMIVEGANIIDLGGESTRPGAEYVGADEEIGRVAPVIERLRAESPVPISVDTRKAAVARAALDAGADMVNDVSALEDDPELGPLVAGRGAALVLMHKRGTPKTMQADPRYVDAPAEVRAYLQGRAETALSMGVGASSIVLDPGIGFGKRVEDNLDLLKHLAETKALGYPVLVGLSRKSFLGAITGRDVADRLPATIAANALAMAEGADILRVHDVAAAKDAAAVVRAWRARP